MMDKIRCRRRPGFGRMDARDTRVRAGTCGFGHVDTRTGGLARVHAGMFLNAYFDTFNAQMDRGQEVHIMMDKTPKTALHCDVYRQCKLMYRATGVK